MFFTSNDTNARINAILTFRHSYMRVFQFKPFQQINQGCIGFVDTTYGYESRTYLTEVPGRYTTVVPVPRVSSRGCTEITEFQVRVHKSHMFRVQVVPAG